MTGGQTSDHMQPNPQQTDLQSHADVPPQSGTNMNAQPAVPGAGQTVPPESVVPGADVYGMDGKTIGTVREVYNDSFLVQKGIFFHHDYYIPYRYVARASNDEVNLTLVSHEALSRTWSQRPGATPGAQTAPASQPGQSGRSSTAGSTAPQSPQTSPDYGTDYGTQQGATTPAAAGQTPPYGDYGRAGSSDTMQDATNRGLQDDLGGAPEPPNANPDQWGSDVRGARDL